MRRLILLAALAFALPAAAQAQDRPRQMGMRGQAINTVEWLLESKEKFSATAEQVTQLEVIAKKYEADTEKQRADLEKAREEGRAAYADRATMMTKLRPIREEMQRKDDAAVADALKILSADQQKAVKALIEARREEMQNRRRPSSQQPIR